MAEPSYKLTRHAVQRTADTVRIVDGQRGVTDQPQARPKFIPREYEGYLLSSLGYGESRDIPTWATFQIQAPKDDWTLGDSTQSPIKVFSRALNIGWDAGAYGFARETYPGIFRFEPGDCPDASVSVSASTGASNAPAQSSGGPGGL